MEFTCTVEVFDGKEVVGKHACPTPHATCAEAVADCDVPPLSKDGQSLPGSLWSAITEVMMHNTSHIRIRHMKCSQSKTLLQFKI
jgi:hypothetical protein